MSKRMSEGCKEDIDHVEIIQPHSGLFLPEMRNLWCYRDLLFFLIRRDFLSKYKQTILGPIWFVIQPLMTTLVFTIVFARAIKISTDSLPPILFYLSGLLAWGYFAQCLNAISMSFLTNAELFKKVYFPRLIVPLSIIASNVFAYALQLLMFLGFYIYFKYFTISGLSIKPNLLLLIFPLLLLQAATLALGVGLCIAACTVKYRDFHHLLLFLTQLWMYATPIIYPMSLIPERWRWAVAWNPMVGIVEAYRYCFFGVGSMHINYLLYSFTAALVMVIVGIMLFNLTERNFVDTI